jgi:hypothetical protein
MNLTKEQREPDKIKNLERVHRHREEKRKVEHETKGVCDKK